MGEEEIINSMKQGDKMAFRQLVEHYRQPVVKMSHQQVAEVMVTSESEATCVNLRTELTPEQKEKLTPLVNAHQERTDGLRTERRSTFDPVKRNEIREVMLQNVQAHGMKYVTGLQKISKSSLI